MLFEGRNPKEGISYGTWLKYITKGYKAVGIWFSKKTHGGRRQGAIDLESAGWVISK